MRHRDLFIHEEYLLMALNEKSGTVQTMEEIRFPLAAAVLTDLLLSDKIAFEPKGKKNPKVLPVNVDKFNIPVLDEALAKLKASKKTKSLETWVDNLANMKDLKHKIARQLCDMNILKADEDKILKIFNRRIYPEFDPGPERELVERLRQVIFSDGEDIDPRDAVLITLAKQTNLLKLKFDKQELKDRKERIKKIAEGCYTAQAARDVMDAVMVMLLMVVIVPAVFD